MRVALMAAGYEVGTHHYIETSGAAAQVVKHWLPDAIQKGDIRPLAAKPVEFAREVWSSVRSSKQRPAALVLACGFPCRELSAVNPDRKGLHQGETARFHEAKALYQALISEREDGDPPLRVNA